MARRVHWAGLLVSSGALLAAACATSEEESGRPSVSDGGRAPTGGSGGAAGSSGSAGSTGGSGGFTSGGSAGALGSAGTGGMSGSGGSQGSSSGGSSGVGGTAGGTGGVGGSSGSKGSGGAVGGGTGGLAGTSSSCGSNGAGGSTDGGPTDGSAPDGSATDAGFCAGFVFCDDFEDGVADGWTKSGGTWSVLDDGGTRVYQGGSSEESWAGPSLNDQTVEARVKVTAFGGQSDAYRAGIMARRSGTSDFYALQIRSDGGLSIRKSTSVISGCDSVASGIDPSQWFTLRLKVSGPASSVRLEGSVNGQPKICCTHASGLASGQAGAVTYGSGTTARFDEFRVSSP